MKKENNNKVKIILIFVIALLIVGVSVDIVLRFDLFKSDPTTKIITKKDVTITDTGIAEAVDKLYDATVIVEIKTSSQLAGWGSGFVYKTDDKYGYVLTNHHVVDDAPKIIIVNTKGVEVDGEVLGSDEYADVAVVRIPIKGVEAVAEIGKSSDMKLGDTVFAIGTPVNLEYKFSVTRGIISGKDRMVQMNSTSGNGYFQQIVDSWYMNLLQIDASINSGNSGGPLANANGEVIGINNSKLSNNTTSSSIENIGFAIPIEDALVVADMILKDGKVYRPVIGVSLVDINAMTSSNYGLDESIKNGALLTIVQEDSLADAAGLKAGDVITKIGDYDVTNYKYLKYYLYRYKKGDKVKVTYIRGKKEHKTTITLK